MKTMRVLSGRSWGWAAGPVLLANLVLGEAAFAAQAAGGAAEAASRFDFFTIWILGGGGVGFLFVLPIELCSVAAVASIIEHLVSIQRDRLVPPEMVVDLEALLDDGQLEEAGALCETRPNYLTAIVGAALARSAEGYDAMVEAAEGVTDEQNLRLQHKISWLNLFSNVGPLLGLLGTVVGMVMAFSQIAMSSTPPTPQELALGIFTALVTTVWGLLVAIPASSAYFCFKVRIQRITFELSGVAMEIIRRLKPMVSGS